MDEHDVFVTSALLGELKAIQTLILREFNPETPEADEAESDYSPSLKG